MLESFNIDVPVGETLTITAGNATRTVNVTETGAKTIYLSAYSATNGVYIQSVSGKLYTVAEWTGVEAANGVAVITDNCRFVVALKDKNNDYYWHNTEGNLIPGVITAGSGPVAAQDYAGKENTHALVKLYGNTVAAKECADYTFPNGQKGYLGAAGEMKILSSNRNAVNTALTACGGVNLSSSYWSSTQYDKNYAWEVGTDLYVALKNSRNYIRPVAAL